jgi:hypothetical protein
MFSLRTKPELSTTQFTRCDELISYGTVLNTLTIRNLNNEKMGMYGLRIYLRRS